MSTNTGVAPRSTNAFAVDTNVYDGMMTSSPGPTRARSAAISSADVQDCVSSARGTPSRSSSHRWHRLVNGPFPERCRLSIASRM